MSIQDNLYDAAPALVTKTVPAAKSKPQISFKGIVTLMLTSLLFAIIIIETMTFLLPGLVPPTIRIFFRDEGYAQWGLIGDQELGIKYAPNLDNFPTPLHDDLNQKSSYPVSTQSLGYEGIGFRDDGIARETFAIVVGDSFASCAGVMLEECWVERLEASSHQDFANLGVITYGPQQTKGMLIKYGLPLKPKLVVWTFFANDPYDGWHFDYFGAAEAKRGKFWENPVQAWLVEHSNTYMVLTFFWYNRRFFYNLATEADRDISVESNLIWWETVTDMANPDTQESLRLTEATLLEAKEQIKQAGAELMVVIIPTREQLYYEKSVLPARLDAQNEHFMAFFKQHDIAAIDLTAKMSERIATEPFLYFYYDIHLNPRGNEIVAELLQEELKEIVSH